MAEEQKEKEYPLKISETEIQEEIQDLNSDKDVLLYLRVEKGLRKYNRLVQLAQIVNKEKK
jgi:hypothetical protein